MDRVATMPTGDRADLFRETGARHAIHEVLAEKDFWVCWTLKQLFTIPQLEGWLTFKGGTSLSKCFGLIRRFSEDVDVAVDFERLGFTGERDPRRSSLSNSRRQRLLGEMLDDCRAFVAGPFMSALRSRVTGVLGARGWRLRVSGSDPNTVEFEYPTALDSQLDYVRSRIVVELGTHAEPIPNADFSIRSFAAEQFPTMFVEPACTIKTMVAHRTFWEKATILHTEYHRPLDKPLPQRYSRHYADVAAMAETPAKQQALSDLDLLNSVCLYKDRFYPCGWARYMEAKPGGFRLAPRKERLEDLRKDYQAMRVMFMGSAPSFDEIIERILALENEINKT